jgi:NADH-ubiquinone oxidoreductase chain 2
MLLTLGVNTIESSKAFMFYLIQYTLTNINTFIILIAIGFSLFLYANNNLMNFLLQDKNNSPIQLISQLKGYFHINPILTISLATTMLSFAGIPPLAGFFAKQMVLSSALDNGYLFLVLIAVITSVISAVYYLGIIKTLFFDISVYKKSNLNINITISSYLSIPISILTLLVILFMFTANEPLYLVNILSIISFTDNLYI